ncbi:MAG: sensor histidine kinase [Ktedonobacterales bacterium]|nr:sensor histidine kinase [Ktedonobacterales bacterium]
MNTTDTAHLLPPAKTARAASLAWYPSDRLQLVAYLTVGIGYLLAVLTAQSLAVPGFALLTVTNLGWLWLFYHLCTAETSARANLLIALTMMALALGTAASIWLGLGLDWLLPVITVSVLTMIYPPRQALPFSVVLYLSMVGLLTLAGGTFSSKALLLNQIQLVPAFLFTYLFTIVMRQQHEQRARAEALVAQVEEAHAQLRAYTDQVEELAITRERNRMAREIHDTLGHYLTVVAVRLETAIKLEARGDAGLRAELVEARRMASECLAEVRRSVAALRPVDPTSASLDDALARLVAEFQAAAPAVAVALDVEGAVGSLAPPPRLALYRCAQEALTNTRKHADATKVLVRVRADERAVELTVLDNGKGADSSADGHAPGFGLLGMGERIALLGGTAQAGPDAAHGWRVEVRVPLGET